MLIILFKLKEYSFEIFLQSLSFFCLFISIDSKYILFLLIVRLDFLVPTLGSIFEYNLPISNFMDLSYSRCHYSSCIHKCMNEFPYFAGIILYSLCTTSDSNAYLAKKSYVFPYICEVIFYTCHMDRPFSL